MDTLIFPYIRDPLYRFAHGSSSWFGFIMNAALIAAFIRWFKPRWDDKRQKEESIARQAILNLLSDRGVSEEEATTRELFEEISMRSIINAFEQLVTRVSDIEQRRLRSSLIALGIETYALSLTKSWLWWRRLEGVLLLRSVGTETSENTLVVLRDQHPSVILCRLGALSSPPIRGLEELIYIEAETSQTERFTFYKKKNSRSALLILLPTSDSPQRASTRVPER